MLTIRHAEQRCILAPAGLACPVHVLTITTVKLHAVPAVQVGARVHYFSRRRPTAVIGHAFQDGSIIRTCLAGTANRSAVVPRETARIARGQS